MKIGVIKVPLIVGRVKAFTVMIAGIAEISGSIKPWVIIKASFKLLRNRTASFNIINDSMDSHLKLNRVRVKDKFKTKIPVKP